MSTRSLVLIKSHDGVELACIYRQCDGYPSGMGADIREALGGKQVVNGIGNEAKEVNGVGDMAVQLIAWLKYRNTIGMQALGAYPKPASINTAGGVYLFPIGTTDCGEEYVYEVFCGKEPERPSRKGTPIRLVVHEGGRTGEVLYDGPLDAFDPHACEDEEDDGDEEE